MALFFIDYENVHENGFEGINELTEKDKVVVFYGSQVKSIPIESHLKLIRSRAFIECLTTDKSGHNYVDFQIATYLGFLLSHANTACFIVSGDTGFDSVVDFWSERGSDVKRVSCIARNCKKNPSKGIAPENKQITPASKKTVPLPESSFPETYRKKVRNAVKSLSLSPSNYTTIYKAMLAAGNHAEYKKMLKGLASNTEKAYSHTQSIFSEFRKN